ncbi:MAG: FG-GAP-like repeat-containing protein [Planctomycetota bacterium]|nr:FG-GAP-like repeat-containing protein [Planctomycetota bacterium]
MKKTLLLLLLLVSCTGDESDMKKDHAESLRNRNLALAYIDSGLMAEATLKLATLESLHPNEAFVYANQGVVALRQNELEKANLLLAKAASLAPGSAEIAILQGQVAALIGNFDQAKKILSDGVAKNPSNVPLRWALSDQLRGDPSQSEHLEAIVTSIPQNIVARLALVKSLVTNNQLSEATKHLIELQAQDVIKDAQAINLFNGALNQIDSGNVRLAHAQIIGLDNVLKPTRAWQHSQLEVAGSPGTIGHPIRNFLNYTIPDTQTSNTVHISFTKNNDSILNGGVPRVLLIESESKSKIITATDPTTTMLVPIDWNNDRKLDVVFGTEDGRVAVIEGGILLEANGNPVTALTPWDADQDGDLDLLLSRDETLILRNNGDGSVTKIPLNTPKLHNASIIDYDEDGAIDLAAIDSEGQLVILRNERSGRIHPIESMLPAITMRDLTVGDFNNDGWMDLAWINEDGVAFTGINVDGHTFTPSRIGGTGHSLVSFDADNDMWLDILVIGDNLQLFKHDGETITIDTTGEIQVVDADLDGDLDFIVNGDDYAVWDQDGIPENGFQKIILESILEGGQRNNSLGVGGYVEVRAGGKYQKRLVTGPLTHIGLGKSPAEVVRVIWPNGVPQDVIEPVANQVFTEAQILKGSCPFLATATENGWEFVTDLLWRSPLGLKINAQTVPPIAATQDWVKIQSDQLTPVDGIYELAITAQLWETHFIDEIKMLTIDHPIGTEIFVDERFVAPIPPAYQLYVYEELRLPIAAIDHNNQDVLDIILDRDENRLGSFAKGSYQGIAENHYVELTLGDIDPASAIDIVASGWIRPTDTSINVASAQGNHASPKAIRIEAANGLGGWDTVIANAGFPAGKLKTIVLELPANTINLHDPRIRIVTNLEIYWDQIRFGIQSDTEITECSAELISADLGYMGYPKMSRAHQDAPNIPDYNDIRHGNAWRDLEGYYTRYGSVDELLLEVDDRYVIMNAGDAMYLQFNEPPPPKHGYVRDFIFFSDGWVKDGDWNTVDSRTVGPLPHHAMSDYPYPSEERPATLLPSHSDWLDYHTRYITPTPFRNALNR